MSKELYPCIKTLDFVTKILNSKYNIAINTNIYNENLDEDSGEINHDKDLYVIKAKSNTKSKIILNDIINLFKHMEKQIDEVDNFYRYNENNCPLYIYFCGFKYDKNTKIYNAKFKHRDELKIFYKDGMFSSIKTLEFANIVVGLKHNVMFNSRVYNHLINRKNLSLRDDFHELSGNVDPVAKARTLSAKQQVGKDCSAREKNAAHSFPAAAKKV